MFDSDRASWQNPRVLITLFSIFLAGAACGALVMRIGLHDRMHRALAAPKPDASQLSYERLRSELNLRPDQASQLKSILDDMVTYRQEMEAQMQAQVEDFRATGKNRIWNILDPDQRQKFDKLSSQLAR